MQEIQVGSLDQGDALEEAWQPTAVFLPGESPWTEEKSGLQPMGSQKCQTDWSSSMQHTLPGESLQHLLVLSSAGVSPVETCSSLSTAPTLGRPPCFSVVMPLKYEQIFSLKSLSFITLIFMHERPRSWLIYLSLCPQQLAWKIKGCVITAKTSRKFNWDSFINFKGTTKMFPLPTIKVNCQVNYFLYSRTCQHLNLLMFK